MELTKPLSMNWEPPAVGSNTPATLDALFVSHRLPMVRLAHTITGSNALAEEIVQEAFTRMVGKVPENPGGYLRTVVVNLCRDHIRRVDVQRRIALEAPTPLGEPELDETWEAIRRLPEKYRTVLALRFYDDLTEPAIAELLDVRVGTVKSLVHRGLARLRKELA